MTSYSTHLYTLLPSSSSSSSDRSGNQLVIAFIYINICCHAKPIHRRIKQLYWYWWLLSCLLSSPPFTLFTFRSFSSPTSAVQLSPKAHESNVKTHSFLAVQSRYLRPFGSHSFAPQDASALTCFSIVLSNAILGIIGVDLSSD